jgi:hypothetical protein
MREILCDERKSNTRGCVKDIVKLIVPSFLFYCSGASFSF